MKMKHVDSSNLNMVGYENGTLCIKFNSGETYLYFEVPERIYHGLISAASPGRYFHVNIKGYFQYQKQ